MHTKIITLPGEICKRATIVFTVLFKNWLNSGFRLKYINIFEMGRQEDYGFCYFVISTVCHCWM